MLTETLTEENRTAYVSARDGGVRSNVPWFVTHVQPLPGFRLRVEFIDGTSGEVEMREQIFSESAGVFATLRDPETFSAVSCADGHVEWADDVDIAPDATYEDFKAYGKQVLR